MYLQKVDKIFLNQKNSIEKIRKLCFLHSKNFFKISLKTSSFNFCRLLPLIFFNYLRFLYLFLNFSFCFTSNVPICSFLYTFVPPSIWFMIVIFFLFFSISISFYLFGEKKKMKLLKKNTQNKEEKFANYQKYTF